MSLHGDLLDQAGHLARNEPKRPRQASLRRAVSAAYYAVFHMLTDAGSRFLIRGSARTNLRLAVQRAFNHNEMKEAANSFKGGNSALQANESTTVPVQLRRLCRTFVNLQQARHEADYDLRRSFSRDEVLDIVAQATQAFEDWKVVAKTPAADAFLVALLLRKRLGR